jgi:hypothetical protein
MDCSGFFFCRRSNVEAEEAMTKGEALKYAIAFALRRSRKIIRGLKEGLTEEERYAKPDPVTSWCVGVTGCKPDRALS